MGVGSLTGDGQVSVVAASPEFQLLAQNNLGERGSSASPAVGDGCLLIRTEHHLFCIESDPEAEAAS